MAYELSALSNGTRLVTATMPDRESVAVAIWVRTGARYEPKKVSGVSHFLEHMLFKGTKERNTREIKEAVEGVGGMLNAFTSEEFTCYFAKVLKDHMHTALDVFVDMIRNATLLPEEVKKERTVILEEIKMYHDLPSHHVHDLMSELLWPNHPLGRPISGTVESVEALSRNEIVNYKQQHYHHRNLLVSIAGPIEHESILNSLKRYFPEKTGRAEAKFIQVDAKHAKSKTLFVEKQMEQTHFVIGMHGLSRFHPDRYKLGLLNIILGANMSSRLFEEVREKRGLAYEIKSGISFYHDTGAVSISAGVETVKAAKTIDVILKELGKLRRQKVSEDELRRAKDYFLSQLCMALEDTLDHMLWLGERSMDREDLPDRHEIKQQIESVSASDIQEICRQLFVSRNLNLSLIGPLPEKVQKRVKRDFQIHGE